MNKKVWILYPCAGRKKYTEMTKAVTMLSQYVYLHGSNPIGTTVIEKTFLSIDDFKSILEDMKKNDCSDLLIENINIFCRNDSEKNLFISYFKHNGCKIHSIQDDYYD